VRHEELAAAIHTLEQRFVLLIGSVAAKDDK